MKRRDGESIKEWRKRVRASKRDNTEYYGGELDYAVVTAPSKETEAFFEDYINRYNKSRFFKTSQRWAKKKLNNIRAQRFYPDEAYYYDNNGERRVSAGETYTSKPLIKLLHGQEDYAYRHELTHQFNDRTKWNNFKNRLVRDRRNSLPKSKKELDLLNSAYSLQHTKKDHYNKELFTVNTGIRDQISRANKNVVGEDLDNAIHGMSDSDLMRIVFEQGYINQNNYPKGYYNVQDEQQDSSLNNVELNTTVNNDSLNTTHYGYDPKQIEAIKKALIEVRKLGGKIK